MHFCNTFHRTTDTQDTFVDAGYIFAEVRLDSNLLTKVDNTFTVFSCDDVGVLCAQKSTKGKEVRFRRGGRSGAFKLRGLGPGSWRKVNTGLKGNSGEK
jgi:hypothetical protein